MRVVCSFVGGAGHLGPMVPLLRALADAGHRLTLIGRASALSPDITALADRVVARPDRRTEGSTGIAPLRPVDIDHELAVVERHFAAGAAGESAAAVAPELAGADLMVCDELDFGAMAVARRAGVPAVVVAVIASGALVRPEAIAPALARLANELDVGGAIHPRGDLFVIPFAPALRDPDHPDPPGAVFVRPDPPATRSAGRERIVATLGTEFNTESGDLFDRILDALDEIPQPSVVAVGRDLDPARFGTRSPQVRVERYIDLPLLLAGAEVVVHHGGSGLCTSAILAGCPQVVLPMGADQPFTGAAVERLEIGRAMDAVGASATEIRAAIEDVARDPRMRERSAELRSETLALPPATAILPLLDSLPSKGFGRRFAPGIERERARSDD